MYLGSAGLSWVPIPAQGAPGTVLTKDTAEWFPLSWQPGGGGGGGTVDSVVAGDGIAVDATDPANPIVATSAPQDDIVYGMYNGAWVPVGFTSVSLFGSWQYAPGSVSPSWGQASNGTELDPSLATEVLLNKNDRSGQNFAGLQRLIAAGDLMYAQSQADAESWIKYQITGPAADNGTFFTIPVTVVDNGPNPPVGWGDVNVLFVLGALSGIAVQSVVGTVNEIDVDATDPVNPIVSLDAVVLASLALANTAVQPAALSGYVPTTRTLTAGVGLDGGGDLSANRTFDLDAATLASLGLADTSVQPADLTPLTNADLTTFTDETVTFPNSRRLLAGTNITLDVSVASQLTINATGGGGAPVGASYVVISLDGTLTSERVLAAEATVLSLTDGGAGGNVTISVATNGITLAKIQQIATDSFLGRDTAATGNVEVLTGTQATTLLDVFTSVLKGLVPPSGGGTTTFLRADGSFATPPGGGGTSDRTVGMTFDGGGSPPTVGSVGYLVSQLAGVIDRWDIVADISGSAVVDVWKVAAAIPTVANTIAGTEKPTLTAQQLNNDSALSTWTTAVAVGDVFGFRIDSVSTCTRLTVQVRVLETI